MNSSQTVKISRHLISKVTLVILAAIALASLLVFLFQCGVYKDYSLDDPYIGFRYARNLVHGYGLVWNAGGPPVEGYTELPALLLSAAAIALGFHPLAALQVIGLIFSLATAILILTPLNVINREWVGRLIALSLFLWAPVDAFYAVSGMGHVQFVFMFTLAALAYARAAEQPRALAYGWAGLLFAFSTYFRPEGLGLFCVTLGFAAVAPGKAGAPKWRNLAWLSASFLAFWIPFQAWRIARYGYFFPNTYYAKHTGAGLLDLPNGLLYLSQEVQFYIGVPLILAVTYLLLGGSSDSRENLRRLIGKNTTLSYGIVMVAAIAGYTAAVGGDDVSAFPSVRLLTPALPLAFMLVGATTEAFVARLSNGMTIVVIGILLMVMGLGMGTDFFHLLKLSNPDMNYASSPKELVRRALTYQPSNYGISPLGRWIDQRMSPPCLVAMPFAGRASYDTDCLVIDTDGLSDLHIAHLPKQQRGIGVKGDPEYVISLKPDMIIVHVGENYALGRESFEQAGGWRFVDRDMIDQLRNSKDYRFVDSGMADVTVFEKIR